MTIQSRSEILFVAFFILAALFPLAAGLSYALAYSMGIAGALGTGFTLQYWQTVLGHSGFWTSAGLSMAVAAGCVLLSTGLALAIVLTFQRQLVHSRLRFGIYWPLAIPPIVAAFWGFQLLGSSGLLARFAAGTGLIQGPEDFPPLINDPGQVGVILVLTMATFPFFTVVAQQFFRSEHIPELMRLARTLGASHRQAVWRIAVPVLLRKLRPVLVLYSVFLFGAYEVPLILGNQSNRMISILIAQKFRRFDLLELPQAYVITVLYALIVLGMLIGFRPGRETKGHAL